MKITYRLKSNIKIFGLVTMLCCYTESYSQYKPQIKATEEEKKNNLSRFSFMVKGGINFGRISFQTEGIGKYARTIYLQTGENNFRIGYYIGIIGEIKLIPNLSINTGLLLNERGGTYTHTFSQDTSIYNLLGILKPNPILNIPPTKYEYSYDLIYIDIPLDLKYSVYAKNEFKAFVNVGGYFGIRVAIIQTIERLNTGSPITLAGVIISSLYSSLYEMGESHFKILDAGMNIGVGVEYKSISLSVNNQIGFADIFNDLESTANRQYALQISLGYRFGIGK